MGRIRIGVRRAPRAGVGGRNCRPRVAIAGRVRGYDGAHGVKQFRAFTRYVCICLIVPLAAERTRSMFALLIAAGAMFLAVAVSAAINLGGPSQQR